MSNSCFHLLAGACPRLDSNWPSCLTPTSATSLTPTPRWISLKWYRISLKFQRWKLPDQRYAVRSIHSSVTTSSLALSCVAASHIWHWCTRGKGLGSFAKSGLAPLPIQDWCSFLNSGMVWDNMSELPTGPKNMPVQPYTCKLHLNSYVTVISTVQK